MMKAIEKQEFTIVKFLFERGANLFKANKDNMNAFHLAAVYNDIHTLDFCIKNRAGKSVDTPCANVKQRVLYTMS